MYIMVKDLERGHRRSVRQYFRDFGKQHSWVRLSLTILVFLAILIMSVIMISSGVPKIIALGGISLAFFGSLVWGILYGMFYKLKDK